jgi:hypothetical protein
MSGKDPRRPKGESGPAKSSDHRRRAAESGLYQDATRFAALEALLGKGAAAAAVAAGDAAAAASTAASAHTGAAGSSSRPNKAPVGDDGAAAAAVGTTAPSFSRA